jgi:hypothetical protein
MTTIAVRGPAVPTQRLPTTLSGFQAVRLLRHPVSLVGLALTVFVMILSSRNSSRDAFSTVSSVPIFYFGIFAFFAANLVASRERRAHSDELLAPVPTSDQRRTAAMLAATLAPAAVIAVLVSVAHVLQLAAHRYQVAPGIWHIGEAPVCVLGAGLLGVAVARWLPIRGASFVVMVALIVWNVWASNQPTDYHSLGLYVDWPVWGLGSGWAGLYPGSPPWHVAYLLALCGLAAVAAMIPGAGRHRRVYVGVGLALAVLVGVCGTAQLP